MPRHMSVTEAAKLLNVGRTTVIRLFHAGDLEGFRKTTARSSHIRIYNASLEKFKEAQRRQTAEAKKPA